MVRVPVKREDAVASAERDSDLRERVHKCSTAMRHLPEDAC